VSDASAGRGRRQHGDRGAVTVEAAVALVAFVVFLNMALIGLAAGVEQVRCVDAAREAARLAARGEPALAEEAAARIAPAGAEITIDTQGEHVQVTVEVNPVNGLLPIIDLRAEAFAVREPAAPDGFG
jgi:hypothetical protein